MPQVLDAGHGLFLGYRINNIGDLNRGLSYQTPVTFLRFLLPNTRNSSYQTPVDNCGYSHSFKQLADRGGAAVESQSCVVLLPPGGVVLELTIMRLCRNM